MSDVTSDHRRQWGRRLYVYPVVSRRARGLSIGVNLNPDKRCNFACLYCQVDRYLKRNLHDVDIETLASELAEAMDAAVSGRIWDEPRFAATPPELRRINDIAFSGDGEPTALPNFDQAVATAAKVKRDFNRPDVKIVVITNATQLVSPQMARALPILDANNGQLWAKLDAGSDEYFQRVNRPCPRVHLEDIVAGITAVARGRAVVIQTLFFRIDGQGPTPAEVEAYCGRLEQILAAGGAIELVQLHTIARPPLGANASALPDAELDAIAAAVGRRLPTLKVEVFHGKDVGPQRR